MLDDVCLAAALEPGPGSLSFAPGAGRRGKKGRRRRGGLRGPLAVPMTRPPSRCWLRPSPSARPDDPILSEEAADDLRRLPAVDGARNINLLDGTLELRRARRRRAAGATFSPSTSPCGGEAQAARLPPHICPRAGHLRLAPTDPPLVPVTAVDDVLRGGCRPGGIAVSWLLLLFVVVYRSAERAGDLALVPLDGRSGSESRASFDGFVDVDVERRAGQHELELGGLGRGRRPAAASSLTWIDGLAACLESLPGPWLPADCRVRDLALGYLSARPPRSSARVWPAASWERDSTAIPMVPHMIPQPLPEPRGGECRDTSAQESPRRCSKPVCCSSCGKDPIVMLDVARRCRAWLASCSR